MNLILLIFGAVLLGFVLYVPIASRRHKRHRSNEPLISSAAIVEQPLSPNGTVLVNGELWPARSNNNSFIGSRSAVKVVGLTGNRLLIEKLDQER